MSSLDKLFALAAYLSVIIPSGLLIIGSLVAGNRLMKQPQARVLLTLLGGGALAVGLLNLFIWINPYGRSISSSLPAFGMLPVVVVLWTLILMRFLDINRLWRSHPYLLAVLILFSLVSFAMLGAAEPPTLLLIAGLPAVFAVIVWVSRRLSRLLLLGITIVFAVLIVLGGGGALYTPGLDTAPLVTTGLRIAGGLAVVLSIFMAAGLVYAALRSEEETESDQTRRARLDWRLGLAVILIAASAYYVFWDGVWSSAHARAFEDHLPFGHIIFALAAGVFLALALKGRSRWAGPTFTLAITTIAVIALTWGWNVSAFELTAARAERVSNALERYLVDHQRYPDKLDELNPRYLLVIPPPVVVRQGGWCYQSSGNDFALGYISGDFTYFTSDFYIKQVPDANLEPAVFPRCTKLVEAMASGDQIY